MDMIGAMRATLELARRYDLDMLSSDIPSSDYDNLESMLDRVMSNPAEFSEAKLGRWLGWMQACVVINSCGGITLEDMKSLNRKFSG